MSQKNKFTKARIVILGSAGVGKTAFAVRYITKRFIGEYDPNKETLYNHRTQLDKEEINLEILDTANDTSEVSMESIIKHADGFILLYAVTDIGSYRWLEKAYKMISDVRCEDHTPVVLVANKIDLSHVRVVSQEDGLQISKKMDAPLLEISIAESTSGVNGAMDEVLRQAKTDFSRRTAGGRLLLGSVKRVFKKKIGRSRSDNIF